MEGVGEDPVQVPVPPAQQSFSSGEAVLHLSLFLSSQFLSDHMKGKGERWLLQQWVCYRANAPQR